jgi:hypothetical protein
MKIYEGINEQTNFIEFLLQLIIIINMKFYEIRTLVFENLLTISTSSYGYQDSPSINPLFYMTDL